jgi:Na+/proline symporter
VAALALLFALSETEEVALAFIDYAVIALYFVVVIGLGFWYQKRAARNLEAYFLGGKRMHWLALAMSGSVSTFDITGTMWIVSLLFVLGMRSMWNHWMWGWMMGAFFLAYMGKWVQRSKVMTGAEWMVTRFGAGRAGRVARTAYALMAVVTLATFIGYAFQGIGKFASVYVGLSPAVCALIVIGTTTLYVLLGGLYSVVITDVIQTVILTLASVLIAVVAYTQLTPEALSRLPEGWASLAPRWRLPELAGHAKYAEYELFGALVIVWVLKGLLLNAGGPAQMYDFQRFLAARSPRDAAKLGASWSVFLIVRWAMCMGIVLLALTAVTDVTDPEKVMPMVLQRYLPVGVRGLVIAGLLAAFMSTFSSTVNSGASYLVRDFWQPFFRPDADDRHLVRASYVATVAIVAVGAAIGTQAESIKQIWNWLMMALGAGVVIPNVLRWYWWRMNGWGYAAGTVGGIFLSVVPLFVPAWPLHVTFPLICAGSLFASVVATLATRQVDEPVLVSFYRTVRPFGAWGSVRERAGLLPEELAAPSEKVSRALLNVVLGMVAITGYYLFPMYLVGHWHVYAAVCLAAALLATAALAFTWYRHLPPSGEG